jgi:hypothetical protein
LDGIVVSVGVEIKTPKKLNWIFTDEPAGVGIIVPGAIEIIATFLVELTPGIPERIDNGTC